MTKAAKPIKLLIANHRWWYPTMVNGADIANHEFARRLQRSGFDVRVFGIVSPDSPEQTRQRSYVADRVKVSLVRSGFIQELSRAIEKFKPDCVMTSCPEMSCGKDDIKRMLSTFEAYDLPVVLYIHSFDPVIRLFKGSRRKFARVITNSCFMADKIENDWGLRPDVIYPVPSRAIFKVSEQPGRFITFFNPQVHKGREIVDSLVKKELNDRSFLYVDGFMEPGSHGTTLTKSGNVVYARQSPDVAAVYMMTNTLLIPSQWEEPFGRVALEAMHNKIPVVASNTGGLPESVGSGGVLVEDYENPEAWREKILLLDKPKFRKDIIYRGRQHVKLFSMEKQIEEFTTIFKKICR